jgi:hypothetical protein
VIGSCENGNNESRLLGCDAMYLAEFTEVSKECTAFIFRLEDLLAYFSTVKMEAVYSSETLVNLYRITPSVYSHRRENLKSHTLINLRNP